MELMTAEVVSQRSGAPYRRLLDWVDRGWFTPARLGGGVHRVRPSFSEADAWEIEMFERVRTAVPEADWPFVLKAIREVRLAGTPKTYLARVRSQGNFPVYRGASQQDLNDWICSGEMLMAVAVGFRPPGGR